MGYTYKPSSSFSGAIAVEKEDFCKGSLACTIFYSVFVCFILLLLASFYQKYKKKLVSLIVVYYV
jgi:hypothetical protein